RGGILRRGLAVERAEAALITNIAEDHFGEFGVYDLASLAEAKLVVARALDAESPLILNADDPTLVRLAPATGRPITWFSLDAAHPLIIAAAVRGESAVTVENAQVTILERGQREAVIRTADVPITLGGAARHNVSNALGAVALARKLGLSIAAIAEGLRRFQGTALENPGRLNVFDLGGARVIVDFAHNPHGMRALVELAVTFPAKRRLVILGQAGDRDDDAIRELARSTWPLGPDRIILKEMEKYLRGRDPGEATGILAEEFRRLGAAEGTMSQANTELEAVREALAWARQGDLLLLPLHSQREEVLVLLGRMHASGWSPGSCVPE
ncbi:MAG: cyanophycin synthetase, partial [Gemmatimonadota bacterium]